MGNSNAHQQEVMMRNCLPLFALGVVVPLLACEEPTPAALEASSFEQLQAYASHTPAEGSDVYRFSDLGVVGSSTIGRHGKTVSTTLHTSDIPAGMAITVWYVVFNDPENCTAPTAVSGCGEADIFDPDVRADVIYVTGHVTGRGAARNFAGQRRVGDNSGSAMGFFNAYLGLDLPSVGLEDVYGSEVHVIVRTHQGAIPAYMPDMIRTFNGGCEYPPGVPTEFGAPGPNTCSDIQFAVHLP